MSEPYDPQENRRLEFLIAGADLHYGHAPTRYDPEQTLTYAIRGVCPDVVGRATLTIERFVGAGFAGQVYKVRLDALDIERGAIAGLEVGRHYAVKINVPASGFSRWFRNVVYWLGFQGPFPYQVHEAAARSGVLQQKLIRRAAALRFNDPRCVVDTYATFFDETIGSFGEINEWVDGRVWRFEIDDHVFHRRQPPVDGVEASHEYLAKKDFMAGLVHLLHDMGLPELARQYEWWTMKSQPNCLRRLDAHEDEPGLTALDFRAGLALLACLPMSPGDFALIWRGLRKGRFVQFDRADLAQLEAHCDVGAEDFADLQPALDELEQDYPAYRAAQPDVTHQGLRLMRDAGLRRTVKEGLIEGWRVRGDLEGLALEHAANSAWRFWLFFFVGLLPFVGARLRRCWGVTAYRKHVGACLTQWDYLKRALRVKRFETLIAWNRDGRVNAKLLQRCIDRPLFFWRIRAATWPLPLPARWQRFLTDWQDAWDATVETIRYPIRFYRDADFRVQWLTDEVEDGAREGMLTDEERGHILSRVPDPFIQKYLKCVAVHVCTLPVTQVISVVVALWGYFYLGKTWQEGLAYAAAILAAFQATPVSPGSLTRGFYVVYLVIKERNLRNYWVAMLVSFWHYIGYLGFPLQMVTRFPALARFMAGRWATKMVHFIPVFGERGALLEHLIFDFFFNVPVTLRRALTRIPPDEEPV